MQSKKVEASTAALLSAAFYGVSIPLVKLFGDDASASWTSALLYFGAGSAMILIALAQRAAGKHKTLGGEPLTRKQVPTLALMVVLNAASALALVAGIALSDASAASLLGNLEVVATGVLAWAIFREPMTKRMVCALALITIAGLLLSWSGNGIEFSPGALLIIVACVFWGLENNCTRSLSAYNVVHVTMVKGLFTGMVSLAVAIVLHEPIVLAGAPQLLGVGVVSYGLSIVLYIWAQRYIGAARTGNYYSIAPFIGVIASWAMFGFDASPMFFIALALSIAGSILTGVDVSKVPSEEVSSVTTQTQCQDLAEYHITNGRKRDENER